MYRSTVNTNPNLPATVTFRFNEIRRSASSLILLIKSSQLCTEENIYTTTRFSVFVTRNSGFMTLNSVFPTRNNSAFATRNSILDNKKPGLVAIIMSDEKVESQRLRNTHAIQA